MQSRYRTRWIDWALLVCGVINLVSVGGKTRYTRVVKRGSMKSRDKSAWHGAALKILRQSPE